MRMRYFGRTQQMWVLIFACLGLFALLLLLLPEITFSLWWKVVVVAAIASVTSIVVFNTWLKRVLSKREGIITLIDRVTSGDLSLNAGDIAAEVQSQRT